MARKAVEDAKAKKAKADKAKAAAPVANVGISAGYAKLAKKHGVVTSKLTWDYVPFLDIAKNRPCLPLEYLFGTRGFVLGRVYQLISSEAAGKSSLLLMSIGMAQRTCGGVWAKIWESEGTVPPESYIAQMGCDPNQLIMDQPASLDAFIEEVKAFAVEVRTTLDSAGKYPLILGLDSLNGLGVDDDEADPAKDDDKSGNAKGLHARKMSEFFREEYRTSIRRAKSLFFVTSQMKATFQIGGGGPMVAKPKASDTQSTLADKPLKFHASCRLELEHNKNYIEKLKSYDGSMITMRMLKNKLNAPGRMIKVVMHDTTKTDADAVVWDWDQTTMTLLFGPCCPDPAKFVSSGNGRYSHPLVKDGAFLLSEAFLDAFFEVPELVNSVREAWRIFGFGFDFETKYRHRDEDSDDDGDDEHAFTAVANDAKAGDSEPDTGGTGLDKIIAAAAAADTAAAPEAEPATAPET